jgi:hypothetical protein
MTSWWRKGRWMCSQMQHTSAASGILGRSELLLTHLSVRFCTCTWKAFACSWICACDSFFVILSSAWHGGILYQPITVFFLVHAGGVFTDALFHFCYISDWGTCCHNYSKTFQSPYSSPPVLKDCLVTFKHQCFWASVLLSRYLYGGDFTSQKYQQAL